MKVDVLKNVLVSNEAVARENRKVFDRRRALVVNLMSSPGAGKTTLIERTLSRLTGKYRMAVIEGDIAGNIDARRISKLGVPAIQINTGGACHLDAGMIKSTLSHLPRGRLDLVFIENVGNLVCPAEFTVGEDFKMMILSLPEGDDKVRKYPLMFRESKVLVVNKMDLERHTSFDFHSLRRDLHAINPAIKVFRVSCKTGAGIDRWAEFLAHEINRKKKNRR